MKRIRINISAKVEVTAENMDDAADLLGDYIGDLGPDIKMEWSIVDIEEIDD